ncbi:MAG: TolC family protein [Methylococcales bacterium]|nr:MAG: TolC family protein [Methylococcales bacterium]
MRPLSIRILLTACTLLVVLNNMAVAETNPPLYTLVQTIDTALANNPELSIMQARIEQADAQLGQSLAIFYPQIKTSLSYQYSNNPAQVFAMLISQRRLNMAGTDFNHPGFAEDYRPQVTASYSLFRGGQDYYQSQAAQLGIETSELEKSATRNRLLSNVTAAFYGELAAIDSRKMSLCTIEAVQSELEQSRARFDAGALLKSDVLSLEVQLAEAQEADIQAANAIEIAHNMLKTLLGFSVTDAYAINVTLESQLPQASESFSELLAKALSSHPELKAAEKRVLIAEKQVAAAKGAHLPRADAFVNYGSDSKNLTYNSNQDNLTAGVMVEMDIFTGFSTQEKIKKAQHELTMAIETARQTRLRIENQLKTAQLRLQEALSRAKVSALAVQASEEALRLVKEQHQAGVVTVTRYIDAEVARDKAQTRQINSHYDALRADAELKQAIGFWQ